ncbi:unnamed protein product, partial [Staurois parvus]
MSLILMISGKNVPLYWWSLGRMSLYIGGHWEECPFILVIGHWEECPLYWWSLGRMSLCIGGHWEECPLHWWS